MKNKICCSRCGKEYNLSFKNLKQELSCDHCHLKMCLDLSSTRKLKYVRTFIVIIVFFAIFEALKNFKPDGTGFIVVAILIMVAMYCSRYADRFCLWLTDKIFGLNYIEKAKEDKKKKK